MTATGEAILSIDGGGIRGLIPALVLQHIEEEIIKCPIAEVFDVIAGTSTGGILALGLTCCDETKRPRYRARELAEIYVNDGQEIFPHETLAKARRFIAPKYSSTGRERVLCDRLQDSRLRDATTDVVVTAYDIENAKRSSFVAPRRHTAQGTTSRWQTSPSRRLRPLHSSRRSGSDPQTGRCMPWWTVEFLRITPRCAHWLTVSQTSKLRPRMS